MEGISAGATEARAVRRGGGVEWTRAGEAREWTGGDGWRRRASGRRKARRGVVNTGRSVTAGEKLDAGRDGRTCDAKVSPGIRRVWLMCQRWWSWEGHIQLSESLAGGRLRSTNIARGFELGSVPGIGTCRTEIRERSSTAPRLGSPRSVFVS